MGTEIIGDVRDGEFSLSVLEKKRVLTTSLIRSQQNPRTFLVLCPLSEQLLLLVTDRIMAVMGGIPGCPWMAAYCSIFYYSKYTVFSILMYLAQSEFFLK